MRRAAPRWLRWALAGAALLPACGSETPPEVAAGAAADASSARPGSDAGVGHDGAANDGADATSPDAPAGPDTGVPSDASGSDSSGADASGDASALDATDARAHRDAANHDAAPPESGASDGAPGPDAAEGGVCDLLVEPPVQWPSPGGGWLIAPDVDGDGNLDLVYGDGSVVVLLGKGDGTFGPATANSAGGYARCVASADFNGDGRVDLVTASTGNYTGTVEILLGNGDGTFQPALAYPVPDAYGVAVGDFNGDGLPDVAAASQYYCCAYGVSVLFGKGDGTFASAVPASPGLDSASEIHSADLNGDGKDDLVVSGSGLLVLLGNGDGTFQPPVSYPGPVASEFVIADLNLDGVPDLASSTGMVFLGKGDGTFGPALPFPMSHWMGIDVGDLDRDGKPDLVTAGAVHLGNGDGTFRSSVTFPVANWTWALALRDFNRDGRLDLAVSQFGGGVPVFLGCP